VLDRLAALETSDVGRADLEFRAAELVRRELADPDGAVERLARVVAAVPAHAGARTALDQLTRDPDTLDRAAAVLDDLYRADGAHDALAELLERRLAAADGDARAPLFA